MKTKLKRILVQISSLLMLVCALPMMLWCLNLINNAALDYEYAGAGCFGAAMVYAFSMVTGIAGLSFSKKLIDMAGAVNWHIFKQLLV